MMTHQQALTCAAKLASEMRTKRSIYLTLDPVDGSVTPRRHAEGRVAIEVQGDDDEGLKALNEIESQIKKIGYDCTFSYSTFTITDSAS